MNQAIQDGIESVIEVVKARANEGDMSAAALLLSRAVPTLKAESAERIAFAFDSSQPLSAQLQQVAQAAADGAITLDQAQQFTEIVKQLAAVRALENGGGDRESALVEAFKAMAKVVPN
jgi:hypothetical protein